MARLLDAVPREDRARVDSALESCVTLSLPSGSWMGAERVDNASLLLVEEGIVFLVALRPHTDRRIVVALADSGSVMLAPAGDERLAALVDSRLTVLTASARRKLMEIPAAAAVLVEAIATRLRDCQDSLSQLASVRHVDRVREKLVQLTRVHGKVDPGGVRLELALTHELLADMVGSTRETVTRALAQLTQDGFVHHDHGLYRLAVPPEAFGS